jgi:hypothetical protein
MCVNHEGFKIIMKHICKYNMTILFFMKMKMMMNLITCFSYAIIILQIFCFYRFNSKILSHQ